MNPRFLLCSCLVWVAASLAAYGVTVDTTFSDVSGSSWGNSANWSAGDVPNNGANSYNVSISSSATISDMGTSSTEITSFQTLGDATFQGSFSGQTLTVDGAFTQTSGTLLVSGPLGLILNGNTTIDSQLTLRNGAGIMNNGNLTVNTASTVADTSSSPPSPRFLSYNVVNTGLITWNNQSDVQFANFVVDNSGTILVNLSLGHSFIAGTYIQNTTTGITVVGAGATLQVNQLNLTAGQVFGVGTYAGSNFVLGNGSTGSTVSPGTGPNTVGNLTLAGNLNTIGGVTFAFDLGGTSQGTTYDLLNVPNNVNFNNTFLTFNFVNGFNPSNTDIFTIVSTAGNSSGMFANAPGGVVTMPGLGSFNVTVGSNAVTLSGFSAVPEPARASLLIGFGILAGLLWRKSRPRRA
jgi:hypothetical protein